MSKKTKFNRLSADERPLFGAYNAVHRSKKDKANSRAGRKKALRAMMAEY